MIVYLVYNVDGKNTEVVAAFDDMIQADHYAKIRNNKRRRSKVDSEYDDEYIVQSQPVYSTIQDAPGIKTGE